MWPPPTPLPLPAVCWVLLTPIHLLHHQPWQVAPPIILALLSLYRSVGYFPMGTYTSAYVPFTSYVTTSTLGGVVTPLASNLGYFGIEAVFAPNMTLSASPQAVICGASANLTVNSSGSYTWSTGHYKYQYYRFTNC